MRRTTHISSAALGLRSLINYTDTRSNEFLKVVKQTGNNIWIWSLLYVFCSQIDSIKDNISEERLSVIFNIKPKRGEKNFAGFNSNSTGTYRDHLIAIRNAIAHGRFTFQGNLVKIVITNPVTQKVEYNATFSLDWLDCISSWMYMSNENYEGLDNLETLKKFHTKEKLVDADYKRLVRMKAFATEVYCFDLFCGLLEDGHFTWHQKDCIQTFLATKDFKYSFDGAKSVWREYITGISETLKCIGEGYEVPKKHSSYNNRLENYMHTANLLAKEKYQTLLYYVLRNAFAHGYVNIDGDSIYIYDKETPLALFSKEKGAYTLKDETKIFEATASLDDFIGLADSLFVAADIMTNIADPRQKKELSRMRNKGN